MDKLTSRWMNVLFAAVAAVAAVGCAGEPIASEDDAVSGDIVDGESGDISEAASALTGTVSVCRYASIRRSPGGQVFGFLSAGENYLIYRHCGTHSDGSYCAWYWGHAYGHVHEDGWIEEGALNDCH